MTGPLFICICISALGLIVGAVHGLYQAITTKEVEPGLIVLLFWWIAFSLPLAANLAWRFFLARLAEIMRAIKGP